MEKHQQTSSAHGHMWPRSRLEGQRASPSSCPSGLQQPAMRASVRHCRVSVCGITATQTSRRCIFCGTAGGSGPHRSLFCRIATCVVPNLGFLPLFQMCSILSLRAPTGTFSEEPKCALTPSSAKGVNMVGCGYGR